MRNCDKCRLWAPADPASYITVTVVVLQSSMPRRLPRKDAQMGHNMHAFRFTHPVRQLFNVATRECIVSSFLVSLCDFCRFQIVVSMNLSHRIKVGVAEALTSLHHPSHVNEAHG